MARSETTWKSGQSGNPKGRPPKKRALTELLHRAGSKALEDSDQKRRARKRIVADRLWELATTGQTTLPGGAEIAVADSDDWLAVVRFLYQQIDGPPRGELDLTSDGQPIAITMVEVEKDYGAHESDGDTDATDD